VRQGKLAQEKGHAQAVKDFGAMMVKDHSAANERLKADEDQARSGRI
jgi:putative membrane protein